MRVEITTKEQVYKLATGQPFRAHLGGMEWRDAHAILYHTANQAVAITLKDKTVITGVLDETPTYWRTKEPKKVWIRMPGRKTRKGILVSEIDFWRGQKAPDLGEAMTAFIVLNSPGATAEQIAEARQTARMM